jgi:CRISPR-associated exonuclease Cas4
MFKTSIEVGFLYYGKTRHRTKVQLDSLLRQEVKEIAIEMHRILEEDVKILPSYSKKCLRCSMYGICLPKGIKQYVSVKNYMDLKLREKE